MTLIQLDVDPQQFQDELRAKIPVSGTHNILTLTTDLVVEQLEERLKDLVASGDILRFKVEWRRPNFTSTKLPPSLRELTKQTTLDLGYFVVTIVTEREDPCEIHLEPPVNLRWLEPVQIKWHPLKTICKYIIRMYAVGLQTDIFVSISDDLSASCQCPPDYLVPYTDGVWDWALRFICKVCGKSYFCECFRTALEKHYPKALSEQSHYGERGWPHKFIAAYQQSEFREGICHLCRDIPSELFYCHPMYGSKVMVHYGPYIVRTAIGKGISQREAENEIRDLLGIPHIGEGWISELELLNMVREILPSEEVVHQASPEWLGLQRLDIFIPKLKTAIEYQGRQHYEPVPFFGGEEGFLQTQERDRRKAKLCAENGVTLIHFRYNEQLTRELVEARIKKL